MDFEMMLVTVLIPLGFFLMVFGVVYMFKMENMAMIEKGLNPKEHKEKLSVYTYLRWGSLLIGSGLGLMVGYLFTVFVTHDFENDGVLWFALGMVGGGLGLTYAHRVEKKETGK